MAAALSTDAVRRGFFRKSTLTLAIRAAGVALLFALHIVLGRVLGPAEYGLYSFALSIAGVLTGLAAAGLPTALMRFVGQFKEQQRTSELKGAWLAMPAMALALSLVVAASLWFLVAPGLEGMRADGVRFGALLLPLFVLEQLRRCSFKALSQPIRSVLPDEIIRPALMVIVLAGFGLSLARDALALYALVTFAVGAGFFVPLWWSQWRKFADTAPRYEPATWLQTALPMAFAGLGYLLLSRTDTIMLGALSDMRATGVYAAASRVSMLSQIILGTAGVMVTPMITRAWHAGRFADVATTLRQARLWILACTLPIYVVIMVFAATLLSLFGDQFSQGALVLRVLATGQLVNALVGPVGLTLSMIGRQKVLAALMLGAAVVNAVLNYWAIPRYGELGAAVASAISFSVLNLLLLWRVTQALASNSAAKTEDLS